MKQDQNISESEWTVMNVLWAESPLTANEIVEALSKTTKWSGKTIRTLINRLNKKKLIDYETVGRVFHYRPTVKESKCVRAEARSLLSKIRAGALKPFLSAFLEEEQLTATEIKALKKILESKAGK